MCVCVCVCVFGGEGAQSGMSFFLLRPEEGGRGEIPESAERNCDSNSEDQTLLNFIDMNTVTLGQKYVDT